MNGATAETRFRKRPRTRLHVSRLQCYIQDVIIPYWSVLCYIRECNIAACANAGVMAGEKVPPKTTFVSDLCLSFTPPAHNPALARSNAA